MKIHLISIGGSIMHNLAISLQKAGHLVSGSDDEIYNPARDRLKKYGLLPIKEGWDTVNIHPGLDLIILGMHARKDNPELIKAQELGIKIYSFPEFIFKHSKQKTRVVVAGSHGKTTTTSLLLHVLQYHGRKFDYLVGAQLEGFENMVRLSDADLMVIEGDEYLSSATDRIPKIWHYYPQVTIITGIAWDHMNVFPTWDDYLHAFREYFQRLPDGALVYYYQDDPVLSDLISGTEPRIKAIPYREFPYRIKEGRNWIQVLGEDIQLKIFGKHNMENLQAAFLVLKQLGISEEEFSEAIRSFQGASKRLQQVQETATSISFLDFAHAPSKVKATVAAVKSLFPQRKLTACLELHTYSSLNKDFLPQYFQSMEVADNAIIYFNEHTLAMKKMPLLSKEEIRKAFGMDRLQVFTDSEALKNYLHTFSWSNHNLLFMTSGTFGHMDIEHILPDQS